ncbi:MAG TPA: DUF5110 domain-containing protein, partial [Pyrinomonadaceae bacterium]
ATLYEDDGLSPSYKTGAFRRTTLTARRGSHGFTVSIGPVAGSYNPGPRKFSFVVKSAHGDSKPVTITDQGRDQQVQIP